MNVSDSERVATLLASKGYEMTPSEQNADVVLINTCSVREKAEQKLYTHVGRLKKTYRNEKKVGVLGCVAQLEGETLFENERGIDFVVGTRAIGRIDRAIESVFESDEEYIDLRGRDEFYDWSTTAERRHSPYVAFVPIIEGCNKFCTYCIVPFSRGREKSLSAAEIVRQIQDLRRSGVREIHLIGQNVNSYRPATDAGLENFGGATPFSRLLRAVAATGIERIKFTTSFPRDFHPDIVRALEENENLCNWVHLPVQSGSDRILREMRRGHTIENYKKRIEAIRASPRQIALTTDIIIGFPGETEADFQATVDLYRFCRYDGAYLFKYSERPGTPAAALADDVPAEEKTLRFLELEKVQKEFQRESLAACLGRTFAVLAEKRAAHDAGHLSGHTTCHRVVNFAAPQTRLGRIVDVRITETKTNTLFGEIR
jgi:tRNA-2-methylthio-N6-dimethylallyladenosine synthase